MEFIQSVLKKHTHWFFVVTGILLYFYSLFNGFVGDDFDQLVNNEYIHNLSNIINFFRGGTFDNGYVSLSGIYYKPVMTTVFSIIHTFFGATSFFYHLVQVCLHISNSILVIYILGKFIPKRISILCALIFLIHPINTEAVAYISNLQDVLFTFFGLSAFVLLLYKNTTLKNLIFIHLLLLLSLLSKESGILFVIICLLYSVFYNRQTLLHHITISVITIGIYTLARLYAVGLYSYHSENFPMMQLQFLERMQAVPAMIFYYIRTLALPVNLSFAQNWTVKEIRFDNFWLPVISLFLLIISLYIGCTKVKTKKDYLFFLIWIAAGLIIHLQILPLDMTVADRWFYFSFIGVLGLGSILYKNFKDQLNAKVMQAILVLVLIIYFVLTFQRSLDWRDQYFLYGHDVKYNTDSFSLQNGWGLELMNRGRFAEAEIHVRKSIELDPTFCYSWNNLGSIYIHKKNYQKAREYYQKAVELKDCVISYNNLATLMFYHFDPQDAKAYIQKVLPELPNSPRLHLMLALSEHKLGNREAAIKAAERSFQLQQSQAAYYVLTNLRNNTPFELKEQ